MTRPAAFLDIELIGTDNQVDRMLRALDTAFSTSSLVQWLVADVGPWLNTRVRDRFQDEGDDVSGRWVPLLPSTQAIREQHAAEWGVLPDHPINKRTGELEEYLTQGLGQVLPLGAGGAVLRYPGKTPNKSVREKMTTAQKGRRYPPTPPRPVLGVNETDLLFTVTSLAFHISAKVKEVTG